MTTRTPLRAFDDPHALLASTSIVDRFLRYVRIDTQSDESSDTCPSTAKQFDLARVLEAELRELGLRDVVLDDNGYVTGRLPGTREGALGLVAHMDTAPAFTGKGVDPRLQADYRGGTIEIGNGLVLDPADDPDLAACIGDTIITTDGTTLLGADDKSGVAAIMTLLEVLVREPEIERPTICVGFTPDEEIGRGAHRFPLDRFDVPAAITVDGGFPGEMNVETFSADKARVTFTGVAVHPGHAYGKMVNALTWAGKFLARLPLTEAPEGTRDREGFFHPVAMAGDAARCHVDVILRDFDDDVLADRGRRICAMAEGLRAEEPRLKVHVEIVEQYRNMANALRDHPSIGATLRRAIEATGLEPNVVPIRGGTDGSQFTAKGLPTPNLFAGGVNFHGPQEWISTRALALTACALLNLVQLWETPATA